jgi:capsule polysaccharide export protein KpsE/RkpR
MQGTDDQQTVTPGGFLEEYLLGTARASRKIVFVCLIVALATAVYSLLVEERYTSYALIMVPSARTESMSALAGGLAGAAAMGNLGVDLTGLLGSTPSSPDLDLAYQIMTSRYVFEQLIELNNLMPLLKVQDMDRAVEKMVGRTSIQITEEGFFTLALSGWTAEGTARLARQLIDLSNSRLDVLITSMTRRARIEAESSLVFAEDSLHAAMAELEAFRDSTGVILPEAQAAQAVTVLAEVEKLLIEAQSELAGVTVSLAPGSPSALSLSRRIAYLEHSLGTRLEEGDSLSALPGLGETPELLRRYEELFMEVETRRAIYILLRQEYEQLILDEARESPMLEILVHPVPAIERSYPKRKNMVIKNTFTAFLVSLGWMLVLTYFRRLSRDRRKSALIGEVWRELRRQLLPFGGR